MKRSPERKKLRAPRLGLLFIYPAILLGLLYVSLFLLGNSRAARLLGQSALSSAMPGRFVFGEVRLGATLLSVEVFGVECYSQRPAPPPLRPSDVRPGEDLYELWASRMGQSGRNRVLRVREVSARVVPLNLVLGQIVVSETRLVAPEVLMVVDHKGRIPLPESFTYTGRRDARDSGGPPSGLEVLIQNISITDGRVVVSVADGLALRIDGLEVTGGGFTVIRGNIAMWADATTRSGALVVLPELFDLVDVRETDVLRGYRRQLRVDPWGALDDARLATLQPRYGEQLGALVAPLGALSVRDWAWENDAFTVADFSLEIADETLRGRGGMAVNQPKRDDVAFDIEARLTLDPGSPLLAYFVGDAITEAGPEYGTVIPDGRLELVSSGTFAELAAEVEIELRGALLGEWPVDRIGLGLTTLRGGPFETRDGGIRIQQGRGLIQGSGWLDPSDGHYALELWIDDLSSGWLLAPVLPDLHPVTLAGRITTDPSDPSSLAGPGLRVSGDLDAKSLGDFAGARFQRLAGRERPDLAVLRFENLTWQRDSRSLIPAERIRASGEVRLTADGRLLVSGPDGRERFEVELDRDAIDARGEIDLLTETFERLRLNGSLSTLTHLVDSALRGRARASVVLDGPMGDPSLRVRRLTLRDFGLGDLRAGVVMAEADVGVGGALPDIRNGALSASDVAAGPIEVSQARALFSLEDGTLTIDRSSFETDYGKVDVEGTIALLDSAGELASEPDLDLLVSASALDLGALATDLGVAGSAQIRASVEGTPSQPRVAGHVAVRDAIALDEWIDALDAEFTWSEQRGLDVSEFSLQSSGGLAEGFLRLDPNFVPRAGSIHLWGVDLADIRVLSELPVAIGGRPEVYLQLVPPEALSTPAELSSLRPAPGYPALRGSVVVRDLELDGWRAGVVALVVNTIGTDVTIRGRLLHELQTRVDWPLDGGPIAVSSRFDRVWLGGLGGDGEGSLRGEVNDGELSAEIRLDDGFDLVADLAISEIWMETAGRYFETARPVHVSYAIIPSEDGGVAHYLSVDELSFGSEQHFVEVAGGIRDWETLNLTVSGEAPLSLATITGDIVEARGVLGIDLSIGGTLRNPAPVGQVGFFEAELSPRGLGEPITVSRGRIQLLPPEVEEQTNDSLQRLRIDPEHPLEGRVFGGSYTLAGQADLRNFEPETIVLQLDATNPSYQIPGELTFSLSRAALTLSAASLSGEGPPELHLSGDVFVQEGRYFRDFGGEAVVANTVVGLFERQGVERYRAPIWEEIPALADLQLDIRVQGRDGFEVRNAVAGAHVDLELRFDLRLTGTLAQPRIEGEVDVIAGTVNFQNRAFTIQECRLTFDERNTGGGLPIPSIDSCVAEARIVSRGGGQRTTRLSSIVDDFSLRGDEDLSAYLIRVSVSGEPPNNLDVVLESVNASLDQRDILALIFTGQTFDTLTTSTGSAGIELVTAELLNFANAYLRETLSVDEIVVAPSTGGQGTVIQVSDQISQRVAVDVDATILSENDNRQRVSGTIKLFDWMLLEVFGRTDADNNVEGGGRIRLRFEL